MLPALIINSCIGIFYFLPLPWIPSFIPSFRLVNVRGLKGNDPGRGLPYETDGDARRKF